MSEEKKEQKPLSRMTDQELRQWFDSLSPEQKEAFRDSMIAVFHLIEETLQPILKSLLEFCGQVEGIYSELQRAKMEKIQKGPLDLHREMEKKYSERERREKP